MSIRICIAIPCYGGQIYAGCVTSLLMLQQTCDKVGIHIAFKFITNQSLITRARSLLATQAVREGVYTHFMFIDADLEFNVEDIMRMIKTDVDLIGSVYPMKCINWNNVQSGVAADVNAAKASEFVITALDGDTCDVKLDDPVEVRYVGTGLMLMKMSVLEKMMEAYPNDYVYLMQKDSKDFRFFDCEVDKDGIYLSEDFWFCKRWRELGGKIYAAMWVRTTHWGTYAYVGDISKKIAK